MVGQNYNITGDPVFPLTSDPEDELSDMVGQIGAGIDPVEVSYRFNIDPHEGDLRRNEVRGAYQGGRLKAYLDYVRLEDDPFLLDREEMIASGSLKLSDQWDVVASGHRDLDAGNAVSSFAGVTWHNECVTILTSMRRDYTRDRDIEPDTSFSVRVALRNLN